MITTSRLALVAVALAGAGIATAPVAAAKKDQAAAGGEAKPDPGKLSGPVRSALADAQKLTAAGDNAGALAKVRAAEASGNLNPTDSFFIAQTKLGLAKSTNDQKLLEEGIQGSVDSPFLPAAEKPKYLANLAAMALQRNDYANATKDYEQLTALNPNDFDSMRNLAVLYSRQNQTSQAIATLDKAIAIRKAQGAAPDEELYRTQLKLAVDAKMPAEVRTASVQLVTAYPTPTNWRDALLLYRDSSNLDDQANLDLFRLMAAAGALNGERDYADYVDAAMKRGLPGEAKSILDQGVAKGMMTKTKPYYLDYSKSLATRVPADRASLPSVDKEARGAATGKNALAVGDAYYGYGDYAKAADMYRLALSKGGVDPATANLRLGASLARAGDKAGAATALQQVKGGPRETPASYWTIWTGQKTA